MSMIGTVKSVNGGFFADPDPPGVRRAGDRDFPGPVGPKSPRRPVGKRERPPGSGPLPGLAQTPRLGAACRLARALVVGPALRLLSELTVEGADRLPADGPLLLVANHGSHLDAPAVLRALPPALRDRTLVAAAADYFYRDRVRAAAADLMGAYPFPRRGGPSKLRLGIDRTAALLEAGWSVLLFPEGTRSRDGRLAPFRTGVVCLARRTGATVVPVAIVGTLAAWPPGRAPRGGPVTVRFGQVWTPPQGAAAAAAGALAAAVADLAAGPPEQSDAARSEVVA